MEKDYKQDCRPLGLSLFTKDSVAPEPSLSNVRRAINCKLFSTFMPIYSRFQWLNMLQINIFSRAFLGIKRAVVPFIAKKEGVVRRKTSRGLAPRPLRFST